jgi:hypothetical protein
MYEGSQVWNDERGMCVSLEGQRCDLMNNGAYYTCADGLTCVSRFGPLEGVCRNVTKEVYH